MKFGEITEEEFTNFVKNHPSGSFFQSKNWRVVKEEENFYYVGVKEQDKIICASLLLSKPWKFNKSIFYAPYGPIIEDNNKDLFCFFLTNLKLFLLDKKASFFHFNPFLKYDLELEQTLLQMKLLKTNNCLSTEYYEIVTKNKSLDNIRSNLSNKAKDIIDKCEYYGLKCTIDYNIPEYYEYFKDQDFCLNFQNKDFNFYLRMKKAYEKNMFFYKVIFDHQKYIDYLNDEIAVYEEEILLTTSSNKKQEILKNIDNLKKEIKKCLRSKNKNGNIILLNSILLIKYNHKLYGLFMKENPQYKIFSSSYFLHFNILKYASNNNLDSYIFLGLNNTNEFSLLENNFMGTLNKLIGDYNLVIDPLTTALYNCFSKEKWV